MKKSITKLFLFFFTFLAPGLCLLSCDKNDNDATLELTTRTVTIPSIGGSREVIVTSNTNWRHTVTDEAWFTVTAVNNTITVSAEANTEDQPKTTVITVMAGNRTETISVSQESAGDDVTLEVETTIIEFTYNDTKTVSRDVRTTADSWDAVPSLDWIIVNKQASSFSVSAKENTGSSTRSGNVTVSAGTAKNVIINVIQAGTPNEFEGVYTGRGVGLEDGSMTWDSEIHWFEDEEDGIPYEYITIGNFGGDGADFYAFHDKSRFYINYYSYVVYQQTYAIYICMGYFYTEYSQHPETGQWGDWEYIAIFDEDESFDNYSLLTYDSDAKKFTAKAYDYLSPEDNKTHALYYFQAAFDANGRYAGPWSDFFPEFTLTRKSDLGNVRSDQNLGRRNDFVTMPPAKQTGNRNAKIVTLDLSRLRAK